MSAGETLPASASGVLRLGVVGLPLSSRSSLNGSEAGISMRGTGTELRFSWLGVAGLFESLLPSSTSRWPVPSMVESTPRLACAGARAGAEASWLIDRLVTGGGAEMGGGKTGIGLLRPLPMLLEMLPVRMRSAAPPGTFKAGLSGGLVAADGCGTWRG